MLHTVWKWVKSNNNHARHLYKSYAENHLKCVNSLRKNVRNGKRGLEQMIMSVYKKWATRWNTISQQLLPTFDSGTYLFLTWFFLSCWVNWLKVWQIKFLMLCVEMLVEKKPKIIKTFDRFEDLRAPKMIAYGFSLRWPFLLLRPQRSILSKEMVNIAACFEVNRTTKVLSKNLTIVLICVSPLMDLSLIIRSFSIEDLSIFIFI